MVPARAGHVHAPLIFLNGHLTPGAGYRDKSDKSLADIFATSQNIPFFEDLTTKWAVCFFLAKVAEEGLAVLAMNIANLRSYIQKIMY
jgi:hypothetical protein